MNTLGVLRIAGALTVGGLCFYFLLRSDKQARQVIDSWRKQGHIKESEYQDAVKRMTVRMRVGYGFLMILSLGLAAIYLAQLLSGGN